MSKVIESEDEKEIWDGNTTLTITSIGGSSILDIKPFDTTEWYKEVTSTRGNDIGKVFNKMFFFKGEVFTSEANSKVSGIREVSGRAVDMVSIYIKVSTPMTKFVGNPTKNSL